MKLNLEVDNRGTIQKIVIVVLLLVIFVGQPIQGVIISKFFGNSMYQWRFRKK